MLPRRLVAFALAAVLTAPAGAEDGGTDADRARDAAAFQGLDPLIGETMADVDSVVVLLQGRVVYQFYRDRAPDALRDVQSVAKSAVAALVGIALGAGRIASLDEPVLRIVPDWAALNPDPRAATITVRHLLTMTAGFDVVDPTGTAAAGTAPRAWARPLRTAPGEAFAYDNAVIPLLIAVLEKANGQPVAEVARQHLVRPLGLQEPSYERGLRLRTVDMARLGQLFLQRGTWEGRQLVPEAFVAAATQQQNAGGPPVSLPYGYLWWVVPSPTPPATFFASGLGGQFIWVHPPSRLVIATTAKATLDSNRRGQALQLIRGPLFAAAQQRLKEQR